MFGIHDSFYAPPNAFLLNPKHQGFLTGEHRRLLGAGCFLTCFMVLFLSIFVMVGGVIGATALIELNVRNQLDKVGVVTDATVTDHRITHSRDSKGRTSTTYFVTYQFYAGASGDDNPPLYSREQSVSSDTYNRVPVGNKISVRYLPGDPNTSRVMNDDRDNPILMLIFMALFIIIPGIVAIVMIRFYFRMRRLAAGGQLIAGKITEAKGSRVKGGYQVGVRYTFLSPEGESLKGYETGIRNDLRNQMLPDAGTPVVVLYLNSRLYKML
jgi:hypothetical protein